jgi:hypothetical protein
MGVWCIEGLMRWQFFLGKSLESVKEKINRLNLEVVVLQIPKTTTLNVLPSVEKPTA